MQKAVNPVNTVVLFLPSPSLRRFWLLLGLLCQFKTFLVLISLTKNTLVQISSLFAFLPRSPPLSPLIYFHSDQASTHFLTDKLRLFESLRTAGEFMRLISSFPFQLLSQNYFPWDYYCWADLQIFLIASFFYIIIMLKWLLRDTFKSFSLPLILLSFWTATNLDLVWWKYIDTFSKP